jgi:hypothetical protein
VDVANVNANFTADTSQFQRSVDDASSTLQNFQSTALDSGRDIDRSFNMMAGASKRLLSNVSQFAAVGGAALTAFSIQSFRAAARVEELDIAMRAVGESSRYSYEEISQATKAIRDNGIELAASQEIALKFAKNNLDMASASKVARVAQDLAVISQANSTETTNRLVHAIITQNSVVLRQAGIQKTAADGYKMYAKEIGKSASALTAQEKQQAIVNLILKEGEAVTGTYEASMRSAGKILRSFPRIINDLQVGFGTMFSQGLAPLILSVYNMVSAFSKLFREGSTLYPLIQGLGYVVAELANPFRMMVDSATRFIKNLTITKETTSGLIQTFRQFLPVVLSLGAGLAALGGKRLLAGIPVLGQFAAMLNPVLVGLVVLIATMPKMQAAFREVVNAIKPAIPAFLEIGKVFAEILVVALMAVVPLMRTFAEIIRPIAKFMGDNAKTIGLVGGVLLTMVTAFIAVGKAIAMFKAAILATKVAFATLSAVMMANPIGLVIALIAGLVAAFILAWKRSETFRKVVAETFEKVANAVLVGVQFIIKILKLLATDWLRKAGLIVKAAELAFGWIPGIGPKVKKASEAFTKFSESVIDGFDKAAVAAENFKNKAVNAVNAAAKARASGFYDAKDIRGADYARGILRESKKKVFNDDEEDGVTAGLKELKDNLKKAVRRYNDFIKYEFAKDFLQGADSARNAIFRGLDLLEDIFEEKAKGLSGDALKKLTQSFNQVRKEVRAFVPQAEALAETFKQLEKELSEAERDLERALENRAKSVERLNMLFREPFGEPSALKRSLSSAEATVDSIINMYDDLVETINQRYEGIDPTGRDRLIDFLTNQTAALVSLARKRVEAVKVLEEAQKSLDDLLSEQKNFQSNLTGGLRSFATAIADLSKADSATTLRVIKTATGLVITQLQSSSSGVDKITKQLQDRLRTIRDFATNIRALLASGLDERYIKQLLEAGPEAASLTAAALATASSDQVREINSLYTDINNLSESFGKDMSKTFYQNAVDMATAFRDGARAEVNAITAQMDEIRMSIENALLPLKDMAANLGNDMMQALVDSIRKRKAEVLAEIEDLARKIADLMAAAAKGIGVNVVGGGAIPNIGGTSPKDLYTPIGVPKSQIQSELNAATKKLNDQLAKLAKGGLGSGALANLQNNIKTQQMLVSELKSELKSATSPSPIVGKTNSTNSGVTNVNSGAVQITVTNNAGTGAIEATDIEAAVTSGMLAALDGRRMVAQ